MFFHHFEKMVPQRYTTSHKDTRISIFVAFWKKRIAEMKSTINFVLEKDLFSNFEKDININIFDILKGVGHLNGKFKLKAPCCFGNQQI